MKLTKKIIHWSLAISSMPFVFIWIVCMFFIELIDLIDQKVEESFN